MSEPVEASHHSITQSSSTQPEKVDMNAYGAPISKNAGRISSRIGKLVRIHVPISYESWDKVPQKYKDDVWAELLKLFELESNAKDFYFKKMSESFRRYKSDLRTNYYDKFDNDQDRSKNCPPTISQEDWDGFLKNEAKPDACKKRDIGKKNRSLYNYGHHTGRTSHAVVEHEMEKIAKAKESIIDSDEEDLPLDEHILSQVFGKDKRGRTRSVGAKISRTQVKASNIARKQLKRVQEESGDLKTRVGNIEGTLKSLVDMFKGYIGQGNRASVIASIEGGSGTPQGNVGRMMNNDVANPLNSSSLSNQKCEILNVDLDVVATASICRDSTASIMHGKPVPPTYEKLVVDNILLPEEKTNKQNHPFATTFGEVEIGGYVCHPKSFIRYL